MKRFIQSSFAAATLCFAAHSNASLISLGFSNIGMETGSSTTFSNAGDVWRATNVRLDGGPAMDALFTITATSGTTLSTVFFDTNAARGNNMRVRIGPGVTNATVFITISFVNSGTSIPYSSWNVGEILITQFSDLDSDVSSDRADFAGARNTQFTSAQTSDNITSGSSLLDLVANPSYANGYTVGIMETPWGPQDNVQSTLPIDQSPVTAAFLYDARNSIDIVVGQRSNGPSANRHIDIDMTPDFTIIPEPTSALLGGIGMLALFRRRR